MSGRKLLIAHVHYAPWSYGGATVVVQAMAERLASQHGWNVLVLTTFTDPSIASYTMKRYEVNGVQVAAVCLPAGLHSPDRHANPRFDRVAQDIIAAFAPDIAHVHCVQNMGATFMRILADRKVPLAVTIHDAWWWCERQFMVMENGSYCHQKSIDLAVCRYCVPDLNDTRQRNRLLAGELDRAGLVLFPSDFFRDIGTANGLPSARCRTNKNGIQPPGVNYRRTGRASLRFGFVGGPGPNKGSRQILEAFRAIGSKDYELVIVDAAQKLGQSWRNIIDWSVPGTLRFHPAYDETTIDDFFASIDVLLFPSLWKESFGLTVREALRRDVWCVVSDAGGSAEDCVPGVNSTVIPMSTDSRYLREALENLLEKPVPLDYENPHKLDIVTCDDQARELSGLLAQLADRQ